MKTRLRIKGYAVESNKMISIDCTDWLASNANYHRYPPYLFNYEEAKAYELASVDPTSQHRISDYFLVLDNETIPSNTTEEVNLADYEVSRVIRDDPGVLKATSYKGKVVRELSITLYTYEKEHIDALNEYLNQVIANPADIGEHTIYNISYDLDDSMVDYMHYIKKWNCESRGLHVPTKDDYIPNTQVLTSETKLVRRVISNSGPVVHKELKYGVKQYAITAKIEVEYERDLFLIFEHGYMYNNHLLAPELLKTIGIFEEEPKEWVRDAAKMNLRHLADKRLEYPRIPMVDEHQIPIATLPDYRPLFSLLLVVANDKKVCNIKKLPGVDIMKAYVQHMLNNKDTVLTEDTGLFQIALYEDSTRYDKNKLKLKSNGEIVSDTNLDVTKTYRIVLYMKNDIQHISTDEKDELMDLLKPYVDSFIAVGDHAHSNLLTYDQAKTGSGRKYKAKGINLVDEADDIVTIGGKKLKDLGKVSTDSKWLEQVRTGDPLPITIPPYVADKLPVEYDTGIPYDNGSIEDQWSIDTPGIDLLYTDPNDQTSWRGGIESSAYTVQNGYPGPHDETVWTVKVNNTDTYTYNDPRYKYSLPLLSELLIPEQRGSYNIRCKY